MCEDYRMQVMVWKSKWLEIGLQSRAFECLYWTGMEICMVSVGLRVEWRQSRLKDGTQMQVILMNGKWNNHGITIAYCQKYYLYIKWAQDIFDFRSDYIYPAVDAILSKRNAKLNQVIKFQKLNHNCAMVLM